MTMESKITKNIDGTWNLSEINTVKDLDNEIHLLKNKLKSDFDRLKEDTTQIPKQAFNATVGKALPFLSTNKKEDGDPASGNNLLAAVSNSKALGIAGAVTTFLMSTLFNKKKGATMKARVGNTAQGLAASAAVQGGTFLFNVFNKWNKRRIARKEIRDLKIKTEVLKLLKEEQKNSTLS